MRVYAALMVAALCGMGSLAAATQTLAFVFGAAPALGRPILRNDGFALYPPWAGLVWSARWREAFPRAFALGDLVLAAGLCLGALASLSLVSGAIPRLRRHGPSGWAGFDDVKAMGLFAAKGAVLGRFEGEMLAYDGPGHLLLIGASRSGKGRGHVVPTLLAWPGSALVLDVKGELADGDPRLDFHGTAGFRASLGPVMRFAPTRAASARFNPLFEVRKGANEVRDVQNVIEVIVDPAGEGRHSDFWDRSAKQVLVGVILHVLYTEPEPRKTLAVVREKLSDLDAEAQLMRLVLHRRNPATGEPEVHPEVRHAADSYLSAEVRVRSGIKATAEAYRFLSPEAAARLSEIARADDPFLSLGRVGRTVHVRSVVQRSDRSWEVNWVERATNATGATGPEAYTGLFEVTMRPPRNADELAANPLGLLISDFSWSRER